MTQRTIEIYSAGCPACDDTIHLVNDIVCGSCTVSVHDMHDAGVAQRAKALGIVSVPAVLVDGRLADCCAGAGVTEAALRDAGVGRPG